MIKIKPGITTNRKGQSFVEYIVVTFFMVMPLFAGSPSPFDQLYTAIRNNYKGYTFAVTRPLIAPTNDQMSSALTTIEACATDVFACIDDAADYAMGAITDKISDLPIISQITDQLDPTKVFTNDLDFSFSLEWDEMISNMF